MKFLLTITFFLISMPLMAYYSDESKELNKHRVYEIKDYDESKQKKYFSHNDSRPKLNELSSVYMGDAMVLERYGYYADCIIPRVALEKKSSGQRFTAQANVPICKESAKDKKFLPKYSNFSHSPKPLKVSVKNKKDHIKLCWHYGPIAGCSEKLSIDQVYSGVGFVSRKSDFQRQIEYAGKSGEIIKFSYVEYSDGLARPSFTRDFQIDLKDGNTVAYKGLVFEIISVDNAMINYKVIRHFPE